MDFSEIILLLKEEPAYRLSQVKKALFQDFIEDWSDVTTLPLALREKLKKTVNISIKAKSFSSKDGKTIKALITLEDNLKVESVLMRHKKRNTVCVSSQVGCPLGCFFCMTGKIGFKRNLKGFEITEQVLFFARLLGKEKEKITNVVFMGMGEPFLNYDNVFESIVFLNEKDTLSLGARRFSISTAGITEGIERMAKENLEVNLAVSLHSPNDKLRLEMIPLNKKYNISQILRAVDAYIAKTKRKVMFEYLLIKDFNDSKECAKELATIMKKPLYLVNLISYNPVEFVSLSGKKFEKPSLTRIKAFREILEKKGVFVTQRYRFGQDIKGACGQLGSFD